MKWIREILPYILIIIVVVIIRTFLVTPVRVDGPSMNPTLQDGEILILNKTVKTFSRMDIVVFYHNNEKLIKRVIGLPGDHVVIENNQLFINGEHIEDYDDGVSTANYDMSILGIEEVPQGYYFVMGDNRYNSADSRIFGLISADDIIGRVKLRLFPFNKIGNVK